MADETLTQTQAPEPPSVTLVRAGAAVSSAAPAVVASVKTIETALVVGVVFLGVLAVAGTLAIGHALGKR